MFDSIFVNGLVDFDSFVKVTISAVIIGAIFGFVNSIKSTSSKSFLITTALIPLAVSMVIMLVNGNIGAGVAVAGAFSLIRFRSTPGTAKEICIIFLDMAIGLALGMGYIAYAVCFAAISLGAIIVLSILSVFDTGKKERILNIMIPEDLDYPNIFDDIFKKYLKRAELLKVKTKNMGSMFKLTYAIKFRNIKQEKEFIDEVRCRNGNLEVMLCRKEIGNGEVL